MGRASRNKGNRREREFAKLIDGQRVPLSGAQKGYENDVVGFGMHWEVKARKHGFKEIYGWLEGEGNPDALALKADRKPWLVCMTLERFKELMKGRAHICETCGVYVEEGGSCPIGQGNPPCE